MATDNPEVVNPPGRDLRAYSDEDRYIALAALDLNAGNVYRTARAIGMPASTLDDWNRARQARRQYLADSPRAKEVRGDLSAKVEALAHDLIEAMPGKVDAATLSQCAVAFGISVDKLDKLRFHHIEQDPAAELCRLLDINRAQLPESLQLEPGESVPAEFLALISNQTIETSETEPGRFEPVNPPEPAIQLESHSPACPGDADGNDLINTSCPCGANQRNAALLAPDDDNTKLLDTIPDDDNQN